MTHLLRIRADFADRVLSGEKTFELRKNDRDFQRGDEIVFQVVWFSETAYEVDEGESAEREDVHHHLRAQRLGIEGRLCGPGHQARPGRHSHHALVRLRECGRRRWGWNN